MPFLTLKTTYYSLIKNSNFMLLLSLAGALNNLFLAFLGVVMIILCFVILIYKYESYKQDKHK